MVLVTNRYQHPVVFCLLACILEFGTALRQEAAAVELQHLDADVALSGGVVESHLANELIHSERRHVESQAINKEPVASVDQDRSLGGAHEDDEDLMRTKTFVLKQLPALSASQKELEHALLSAKGLAPGASNNGGAEDLNQGSWPTGRQCLTDGSLAGMGCGFIQASGTKGLTPLCRCPLDGSVCTGGTSIQANASTATRVRPALQVGREPGIGGDEVVLAKSLLNQNLSAGLWSDFLFGRCMGGDEPRNATDWKSPPTKETDQDMLMIIMGLVIIPPLLATACCCWIFIRRTSCST